MKTKNRNCDGKFDCKNKTEIIQIQGKFWVPIYFCSECFDQKNYRKNVWIYKFHPHFDCEFSRMGAKNGN